MGVCARFARFDGVGPYLSSCVFAPSRRSGYDLDKISPIWICIARSAHYDATVHHKTAAGCLRSPASIR